MAKNRVELESKQFSFPGLQVTWAGEFPARFLGMPPDSKLLCFATDDGAIQIKDLDGRSVGSLRAPQDLEAINGIAFAEDIMAVSTPAEVVITRIAPADENEESFLCDHGAHGVIATRCGRFMAPIGARGIMQIERSAGKSIFRRDFRPADREIYFYKTAELGSTEHGDEVFACAGRKDGLLTLSVNSDGLPFRIDMLKGQGPESGREIDIVDVCPLPATGSPFAVVGLGMDNALHFVVDIRQEDPPISIRLPEMRGTGYTILAARGHVFVLTSEAFYILPELGTRFHRREVGHRTSVLRNPVEALDFTIAYGEYIVLITEEGVALFEISRIPLSASSSGEAVSNGVFETTPVLHEPVWEAQRSSLLECVLV